MPRGGSSPAGRCARETPASIGLNLRKIVENALLCNAVLVALAHNHPSGVALPSHEDKIATLQVKEALEAVHVRLADPHHCGR